MFFYEYACSQVKGTKPEPSGLSSKEQVTLAPMANMIIWINFMLLFFTKDILRVCIGIASGKTIPMFS